MVIMSPEITSLDIASPESDHSCHTSAPSPKRSAGAAGLTVNANGRPVKRRASKACQCCRARKVRCNVVEHGAPCTNCRLDEVPCIVTESKRRKKHSYHNLKPVSANGEHVHAQPHLHHQLSAAEALANGSVNPIDISNPTFRSSSHSVSSGNDQDDDASSAFHVPHPLYQKQMSVPGGRSGSFSSVPPVTLDHLVTSAAFGGDLRVTQIRMSPPPIADLPTLQPAQPRASNGGGILPGFIKPLPPRMAIEDVGHLWKKGALFLPEKAFRDELLRSYIEFVHPYMPLVELHDFLRIVDTGTGENGKISLLLFQAVMFSGVAFVDMSYLTAAGFHTRKSARKAFYLKARALYDLDYESDRVAIVQALLLLTYWYETPDDQKDTWHWMGIAICLAHTIGLHRNPITSTMDVKKQKLWKRIWWSCFMRDRLVALGMRRPTRIKEEDYDVPMLTLDDFEIMPLDPENKTISPDCKMIRDVTMQKDLAMLCIAKAKLCLCISHVLSAQYSVLVRDQGMAMGHEGNTRSSVMLFPKKLDQLDEVKICDSELEDWLRSLPAPCLYHPPTADEMSRGARTVVVQRALLHMCYFATLSALHRPQVLPSAESASMQRCREPQDLSRKKVREASREITLISQSIHALGLTAYLPTTGVTVLLPAIIIHLLDIKSFSDATREEALQGFCQCMQVLDCLRDNYAAADFATQFLEAAIRKADIDITSRSRTQDHRHEMARPQQHHQHLNQQQYQQQPPKHVARSVSQLVDAGRAARLTPPPDGSGPMGFVIPAHFTAPERMDHGFGDAAQQQQHGFLTGASASTPPNSDSYSTNSSTGSVDESAAVAAVAPVAPMMEFSAVQQRDEEEFEEQFEALIDFDGEAWGDVEGGVEMGMHGESGGFMVEMEWMKEAGGADAYAGWVAGSPADGELQQGELHQGLLGKGLSEEEQAVFLLQDGAGGVAEVPT